MSEHDERRPRRDAATPAHAREQARRARRRRFGAMLAAAAVVGLALGMITRMQDESPRTAPPVRDRDSPKGPKARDARRSPANAAGAMPWGFPGEEARGAPGTPMSASPGAAGGGSFRGLPGTPAAGASPSGVRDAPTNPDPTARPPGVMATTRGPQPLPGMSGAAEASGPLQRVFASDGTAIVEARPPAERVPAHADE